MTHSDIYTKFMIEYDKDNTTSSYPSLTRYEVATVLDKAYLALIAQKLTGNNVRNVPFEGDIKATEDLRQLVKESQIKTPKVSNDINNQYTYTLPEDLLYYISGSISLNKKNSSIDKNNNINQNVVLITHDAANKFKSTNTNMPWVKTPVSYISGNEVNVLVDPYDVKQNTGTMYFTATYIKLPNKFATSKGETNDPCDFSDTKFELSDTMAEELINLAIIMSTEIVESGRLATKNNIRPLES